MPLVTFETLRRVPITHAVSLGAECVVAYNLRRHYNFSAAFPFDWWITPIEAVSDLLTHFDVGDLYQAEKLSREESINTVRHSERGIWLHHEFPRECEETENRVVRNYLDFVERAASRTSFLRDRLFQLNRPGNRILFARKRSWNHEADGAAECLRLIEILEETFPLADFSVLLVNYPSNNSHEGSVVFETSDAPELPLHAANAVWDRILTKLDLKLVNGDLGTFSEVETRPE